MKDEASWRPTKFVFDSTGLRASRDPAAVAVQSRMTADLTAGFMERALREHAAGALLDLGCGTVPLYEAYRPYVAEVHCIDWGNSPHSVDHVDVQHDLTQPLPFVDSRFDTILLSDVLEHLPEPESLWRELARVLVPGGKVILNVPFLYWLHEEPFDYYRYTQFALCRFAEKSGFRVIEITPLGGAAEVVTDIIGKALPRHRYGRWTSVLLQWMCTRFSGTGIGKRFRIRTGKRMPLAYGMIAQRL